MAKNVKEVKEKKVSYFKAMKTELKKVTWPTPKELVNNTVAVISFVLNDNMLNYFNMDNNADKV